MEFIKSCEFVLAGIMILTTTRLSYRRRASSTNFNLFVLHAWVNYLCFNGKDASNRENEKKWTNT